MRTAPTHPYSPAPEDICLENAIRSVRGLFDARVRTTVTGMPARDSDQSLQSAINWRKAEFCIGRICARTSLAWLGGPGDAPLPPGPGGAPIWPDGYFGSISHSGNICAAAVGRKRDGILSLGLDIERPGELAEPVVGKIVKHLELDHIVRSTGLPPPRAARLAFSMKEAVFKCQYPLTHRFLEFTDIEVSIDANLQGFDAMLRFRNMEFSKVAAIKGKFILTRALIAAGATCEAKAI